MSPQKLGSMANQIARFFHAYPAEEAAVSVKHHLVAFWTPAMLATLEAHIEAGAPELDPLVIRALHRPDGESLVDRAAAPLREAGQMASDAG